MQKTFLLILIIVAILRVLTYQNNVPFEKRVRITQRILIEPVTYETYQRVTIAGLKANLPLEPKIHYGDQLTVDGKRSGDKLKEIKLIEIKEQSVSIFALRAKIISFIQKSLPEPHSSLVAGTVIGSKASIPLYFWENLKRTGTAHVVVASGMNVSLVAGTVLSIMLFVINRKYALILTIMIVWLYCLMAGMDAPIVRASLMGSLTFLAQLFGRLKQTLIILIITCLIMLIFIPLWFYDVGFWLSAFATGSIVLFEKRIQEKLTRIPSFIRADFSTSLAAQIGVAPILFMTFGNLNLLSPVINIIVLWTIPIITILGLLASILVFLSEPLAKMFLYLAYPFTYFFITVVNGISEIL